MIVPVKPLTNESRSACHSPHQGNGHGNGLLIPYTSLSSTTLVSSETLLFLKWKTTMFRVGEQTNETTTEARASVNVRGMTTVLGGGLVLVIVAFTLIVLLT